MGEEIYGSVPHSDEKVTDEWREKDGTRGLRMKGDKRQTLAYHDTICYVMIDTVFYVMMINTIYYVLIDTICYMKMNIS